MKFIHYCGTVLRKGTAWILGVVFLIALWYQAPSVITALMDYNLVAIKWICAQLPPATGKRTEPLLRTVFYADKALLIIEAKWFAEINLWLITSAFANMIDSFRSKRSASAQPA